MSAVCHSSHLTTIFRYLCYLCRFVLKKDMLIYLAGSRGTGNIIEGVLSRYMVVPYMVRYALLCIVSLYLTTNLYLSFFFKPHGACDKS